MSTAKASRLNCRKLRGAACVVDERQPRQQRLEAAVRGVAADHQRHPALRRHRMERRLRQPFQLGLKDRLGARRHQPGQGLGLVRHLVRVG